MPALHAVARLALALGCTLGCVKASRPAPATVTPGCYAVYADNWPTALAAETGLHDLPTYVALDTAPAGPRGHRVIVPTSWESADPNTRSAYWRVDGGSLVLNVLGPRGDFTAALQPSGDGYIGDGVGLLPGGARWPEQVHLSLVPATCAGLTPAPGAAPSKPSP